MKVEETLYILEKAGIEPEDLVPFICPAQMDLLYTLSEYKLGFNAYRKLLEESNIDPEEDFDFAYTLNNMLNDKVKEYNTYKNGMKGYEFITKYKKNGY